MWYNKWIYHMHDIYFPRMLHMFCMSQAYHIFICSITHIIRQHIVPYRHILFTIYEYMISLRHALFIQNMRNMRGKYISCILYIYLLYHTNYAYLLVHVWCNIWIYCMYEPCFVNTNMCEKYISCILCIYLLYHSYSFIGSHTLRVHFCTCVLQYTNILYVWDMLC